MRRLDLNPLTALAIAGLSAALGLASCSTETIVVREGPDDSPPIFAPADASVEAAVEAEAVDVPMCPVTTCSLPWATCPSSKFPCDVDLLSDDNNCGECGIRCSDGSNPVVNWTCVGGRCVFGCGLINSANCDGDPNNGCEVSTFTDKNNCGGCGIKCADGFTCNNGECINGCLQANKPDKCNGVCTNLASDDKNCETCGNACDPTGPNLPPLPADMYYGCGGQECGRRKCKFMNAEDCNGDLNDGCETTLHTNENCGACGDACPAGKQCLPITGNVYACLCLDDEETLCGTKCKRLDDDPLNCGGCDRICPGAFRPHFSATCAHGICGGKCEDHYADCDGFTDNGCEVNTSVDNQNCGACGNACLPGQVCSEGKCLVAPCDAGAPGDPTK
jgi:hypothetical protein